nr:oxygen sensor histidine kinase response regulator DevS/DosS-like [Nerophis lumbriciformis]
MPFDLARYPVIEPAPVQPDPVRRMPTLIKALQQQKSLRSVIESISTELDLRPLLTQIVRHACELLDAWDGAIGLYDPKEDLIRIEACYRMPENEIGSEFRPGVGLAGQVLQRRAPVTFDDYLQVPHPTRDDRTDFAVLGVPIVWQGRLIGFFGLGAPAPHRFGATDIESLGLLGRHAAIAIHNAQRYQDERERAQRWALVARVGKLITSGLELDRLLQTAVDVIHETLGYPTVCIGLVDSDDPSRLRIDSIGGMHRELLSGQTHYLPLDRGIMGAAVSEGSVQRVNDVSKDPRYVPPPGTKGIRAELAVPLLFDRQVLGTLNAESSRPFSDDDVASFQVVADHLAVAIDNARLFASGQRLAVLEERQRLAHDLHDSVSQRIFSTLLLAQSIVPAWQRDPREGEGLVEQVVRQSQEAQVEMRALLTELRPDSTPTPTSRISQSAGGLLGALVSHDSELEQHGLELTLEGTDYQPQAALNEDVLYRIAREALHNVVKHAQARQVKIRLSSTVSQLLLEVIDDGVGPAPRAKSTGLGLTSMRSRAEELGGRCELIAAAGGGSVLRVELPATAQQERS